MLRFHGYGMSSIAGLLLCVGGCATLRPPAANSGPALSKDGVQVAVLRQACSQTEPVDEVPTGSIDETVEIQVRNGSPEPVTVHPDKFRLIGADGSELPAVSQSADGLTVANGNAQTLQVRFAANTGLDCTKEMRLDAGPAITLRDSPVALQPVPFRPL